MKVIKKACEICNLQNKKALEIHHMIPRTDPNCTESFSNLACICGSCHNLVHAKEIIIEGRFLTSAGMKLFWHGKNESYHMIPGIILNADGTATVKIKD